MMVEMLRHVCRIVDGNLREARKYAECASKHKGDHKAYADWCASMARMHLDANTDGIALADRMVREMHESDAVMGPGVKAMYADCREDWAPETAQIKMMLDMYGR